MQPMYTPAGLSQELLFLQYARAFASKRVSECRGVVVKRWQAPSGRVGGGSMEANLRLSNSRAKSRLVSLTTELKSARLLLGMSFCVSTESSGTWGQEAAISGDVPSLLY